MSDKPIVPSGIMTEFGVLHDDPQTLMDEMGMNRDVTYVPGFSDMRRAADFARSERGDGKPQPLPVNLRWARRTRTNGTPTTERLIAHRRNGYEPVTQDDVGKPWLTELPAGADVLADGTIASADGILMKCTAQRAAKNEVQKRLRWMEQNTASQTEAVKLVQESKKVKGSTVEATREVGAPITG